MDARFTALLEGVDPTEAAETLETLKAQISTAVAGAWMAGGASRYRWGGRLCCDRRPACCRIPAPFPFYHSPQTNGLAGDDVAVELQVLQMARTIRGKLLDPFHADMVANTSALFNAAIVSGDLHLAADYCAELISYYRHM